MPSGTVIQKWPSKPSRKCNPDDGGGYRPLAAIYKKNKALPAVKLFLSILKTH